MKNIVFIILISTLFFGNLVSQAPNFMSYQAVIWDADGNLVSEKMVSIKISIFQGSVTGMSVYTETHRIQTNANGLVSLMIGGGTNPTGKMADINWGSGSYFLKTETDPTGGVNFSITGTTQMVSVPYAMYAKTTDTSSLNLVNRFASKVNHADTASMLVNYRTGLNGKVSITDTAKMLANYLRKSDTLKLSNSDRTIISDLQKQVELLAVLAGGLVDIDGNIYPVVKIGNQVWMRENLRVSRYRNGEIIPIVTDYTAWANLNTGARSWYSNDSTTYEYPYGNLYNWYAVSSNKGICPSGWHVPTDTEWNTLTTYLGGSSIAGGKMKSVGTSYWNSPNTSATNESGFTSLPGGYRLDVGSFYNIRNSAFFWSATESDGSFSVPIAWYRPVQQLWQCEQELQQPAKWVFRSLPQGLTIGIFVSGKKRLFPHFKGIIPLSRA